MCDRLGKVCIGKCGGVWVLLPEFEIDRYGCGKCCGGDRLFCEEGKVKLEWI